MEERDFFNERAESRNHTLTCPHCGQAQEYQLNWLVRRKKPALQGRADERDRARFAKAQSYMVLRDDLVGCKNIRCRKRFEVTGIKTMAFLDWGVHRPGCGLIADKQDFQETGTMANKLIPAAERNLTPEEVEILDARRRRGQLLLVMGGQSLIVCIVLTLWAGQDATYSPGMIHPMVYWCFLTGIFALTFLISGLRLRKGTNEFQSY